MTHWRRRRTRPSGSATGEQELAPLRQSRACNRKNGVERPGRDVCVRIFVLGVFKSRTSAYNSVSSTFVVTPKAMCYSLPTPEDPFLNRKKYHKSRDPFQANGFAERGDDEPTRDTERRLEGTLKKKLSGATNGVKTDKDKKSPARSNSKVSVIGDVRTTNLAPFKKVVWDLNFDRLLTEADGQTKEERIVACRAFQVAVFAIFEISEREFADDSEFVFDEFERLWWAGCAEAAGVLGAGGGTPCIQAYAVGAAAHVAVHRKFYGSTRGPIALILVNSKEQAHSVRQICKTLKKVLNIHSISLHSDASIEQQVNGLAVQKPEILIATPERLSQLLSLQAVNLSAVSYMVVDGLDDLISGGCREQLDCIHQQLRKGVQIGVISKTFPVEVLSAALSWLQHPIFRAVTAKNMPASSFCITQLVSVVTTEEAKLAKINKILAQLRTDLDNNEIVGKLLLIVKGREQYPLMKELLRNHNFVPDCRGETGLGRRKERESVRVESFDTHLEPLLYAGVEVVIIYDFCWPIHHYTNILSAIARRSLKGRIETVCSGAAALQAKDLADLLDSCGQLVPRPLSLLAQAAALLSQ